MTFALFLLVLRIDLLLFLDLLFAPMMEEMNVDQ